ncbi:hypothetical protein [Streptomyces sp. R35]|uniref:Uncharacterized protein n=1 Tax=Streptomyces sp. R35 TaxID=3238630 RepID=A0AB39SFW7_9ACTN
MTALQTADQSAFWQGLVSSPASRIPHQTLAAAGWSVLPDAEAANLLTDRYSRTTRNPDRQAVLGLWKAASITTPAARVELIQRILIPMLEVGQGAADSALAYLPQLMDSVPRGVRTELRTAVAGASKRWQRLEQRGTTALKAVGYSTERTGLLRRERISRSNDD